MTYGYPLRLLLLEIVFTVKSTLPLEMRIPELSQLTTLVRRALAAAKYPPL